MFIGVSDLTPADLLTGRGGSGAWELLTTSRLPRTLAAILAGMSLAVAGYLMQLLARNRFVEPSTVGTTEAAGLGVLVVTLVAPAAAIGVKMVVATVFAIGGTALFLAVITRIRHRGALVVPLVGIMLGGVIGSVATFIAYKYDLLQSLGAWMLGDFSGVIAGRYELLWVVAGLTVIAYVAADRLTVAGMGEQFATNLGLDHRRIVAGGLTIVALISAIVVVVIGAIPFVGLVVPNLVSMAVGDNARRALPWVAVTGAGLVVACDILGRVIRYPYEIPVGTVLGIVGAIAFLVILMRRNARLV